jgi:signal transduction histidine kinase
MTPDPASDSQQRLSDKYQEIARLAGGLAHEIKNPLSTIRLNMELLGEEFNDSDLPRDRRVQSRIAMVQRQCDRLQGLLDDFLNYAKTRQTVLEPSDLNEEILRAIDFFRPKAAASKIEIFPYLQSDLPSVLLDRESFQGALLNLLLNAQQAMPGGGQLVVGTESTARGVALHLIDTGCGMDTKTMGRIFEAFYSTKPGGSGLGLPTTRKIIEAHDGTIFVQSEPGRGTRFSIELPTPARIEGKLQEGA